MKVWSYRASNEGLKRGPKPDPTIDKVVRTITVNLTLSEFEAFEAARKSVPCPPTRSAFGRYVIKRFMERHRVRSAPGNVVRFVAED